MSDLKLEEHKESLIFTIEWYRDDYFSPSMKDYCNELIEAIKNTTNRNDLDFYDQQIDDWLDY